jgi:hypothetical protein
MGYQKVTITHGPLELGRDLAFLEVDRLGRSIWRAVQAKAGSISGSLAAPDGARAVVTQCQAALDSPYTDTSGEVRTIQEVWLVCTHQLTEHAKNSIAGFLRRNEAVTVIDGAQLLDLVQQFMPEMIAQGSAPIQDYLNRLLQFCDSPEDYLAAKLSARFSLSDVFVVPTVSIELLPLECFKASNGLADAAPIASLASIARDYVALLPTKRVPGWDIFVASGALRELREIARALPRVDGLDQEWVSTVSTLVERLNHRFGFKDCSDPYVSHGGSADLKAERLQVWDAFLRTLSLPEIGRLQSIQADVRSRIGATVSDEEAARLANAYLRKQSFYTQLSEAYRGSLSGADNYHTIATALRDELVRSTRGAQSESDAQEIQGNLVTLSETLARVDAFVRRRYEDLWREALGPKESMTLPTAEGMPVLAEMSRLTWFYLAFGAAKDFDILTIPCDPFLLARISPRLLIAGHLGNGKSTLIKRLCSAAAEADKLETSKPIPILIQMASVRGPTDEVLERSLIASAKYRFSSLDRVEKDELSWFVDGLDEAQTTAHRDAVLAWAGSSKAPKRLVLTSRPSVLPPYIPGVTRASIRGFSEDNIAEFVRRFPWRQSADGDTLIQLMRDSPELIELARTPLLLTLLAVLSYVAGPERLPTRRELIYEWIVDLLLGAWDAAKGIRRPSVLPNDVKKRTVQRVSLDLYTRRSRGFQKAEFVAVASRYLPASETQLRIAENLFDELLRDCVLVPLSHEEYGFFHFSVQEYLAAAELAADVNWKRLWSAVEEYFRSGWWEEVIVFYAGLKRDVAPLINELYLHVTGPLDGPRQDLVVLVDRWLKVGDFTRLEDLNPKGSVAQALAVLKVGGSGDYWAKLADLGR